MNTQLLEERILLEVTRNPNISMRELARQFDIQPVQAGAYVQELRKNGKIKVDSWLFHTGDFVGPVSCIMETTVSTNQLDSFKEIINTYTDIEFCYQVAGDACFLVKVQHDTYKEIETFIRNLQTVVQTIIPLVFPVEYQTA
ncbi:Lrp/AsnC family transcriptional regulator [Mangrovibacillus cuniculi]|uniref:Winged helix-turn-helix transcriptional regulator n=1 Tax=Mangrovibacillus cuniculi TaxID=2593652 RepID=A0A7S8CDT0_9BACI|nr:Lrp/AsnC ligand binding domain-containing protein [Mangrovibacillus cuniculi]QPC48123.1 winged helix-turn-helix transcriptional regulator [Mangrovibacillus cuniculi]